MDKENELIKEESATQNNPQETPKKSNRDTFMERYKADYPDDDSEDEETVYGRMNERNAAYDKLKKNDDDFRNLVTEHPQYGAMFIDAADGKNFIESFLGRFPKEDILAAYDDPEMAKKLADKQAEYIQSQQDSKKLKEEGEANIQESIGRFSDFCEKNGIDGEEANKLWGKCIDFYVEGLQGKFSDKLFETVMKAENYADDVEGAREEGLVAGHNAKVKTQLARGKEPAGIPPTFDGGQGNAAPEEQPKERKKYYNPFSHEYE